MVLAEIIKTNLKQLARSKTMMLVLVLAPLVLLVAAAMAFDSQNTYNLSVGTYADHYSREAGQFVENLAKNKFSVTKFSSAEQCLTSLKDGAIVCCLVFDKEKDDVAMYLDSSKINLADSILSLMAQRISEQASNSIVNVTQDLVQRMENARAGLQESRPIIIELTTQNEASSRKISELSGSLSQLSLTINQSFESTALHTQDNTFIEWITSLSGLVNDMVVNYQNTMTLVRGELDESKMTELEKQKILALINQGESSLAALQSKLSLAQKISQKDLDTVLSLTQETVGTLKYIQSELDGLKSFKSQGTKRLGEIHLSLDQTLLKYIALQSALNKIDASLSSAQLENPQSLIAPMRVRVEPITTTTKRFALLFPALLMIVIMVSSICVGSAVMMQQKNSSAQRRNKMTPVSEKTFLLGAALCALIVVAAQTVLMLGLGLVFFGSDLLWVFGQAFGVILMSAAAFIMFGMMLALWLKRESSVFLAGMCASTIMIVFSDMLVPLEAFPKVVQSVIFSNPLMSSVYAVKRVVLFHVPVQSVLSELAVIVVFFALCAVIVEMLSSSMKFSVLMQKIKNKH